MTTTNRTRASRVLDPVLDAVRTRRSERDGAEVALLKSVLDWAIEHTVVDADEAATYIEEFGDTGLTLAGPGAPCVSEFDTYELAAALGMTSDSGKRYVGRALELRYRLPRIYARVVAGELQVWKAGKIADATLYLPEAGATYVDRMLAPTAHKVGIAQLDRLVEEALIRFDPEEAERRRDAAAEGRHFDVYTDQVGFEGTVEVSGTLDLSDALDLDAAIRQGAKHLGDLGCEQSLDVRRSMAAGELARHQLALDLGSSVVEPVEAPAARTGRGITIVVHVADPTIARYGRALISVDQVVAWCQAAGTAVKVQPVVDLNEAIQVGAYEIPDRIHDLVALRDHHCVFPHCTRPARCCDTDHITPSRNARPPIRTTSHPCAGCTTAPRPTPPGPTTHSPPASTSGPAPEVSGSRPTTPAPPTSTQRSTPDRPAPNTPPTRRGQQHATEVWCRLVLRLQFGERDRDHCALTGPPAVQHQVAARALER